MTEHLRRLHSWPGAIMLALIILTGASQSLAQSSEGNSSSQPQPSPTPRAQPSPSPEHRFFADILRDQRAIWTSPFNLRRSDAKWLAPIGFSAVALLATDRHTSGELVEHGDNRTRLRISKDIGRFGSLYATGGVAAAFYLTGRANNNARARETGLLGAEALLDSGIVVEILKTVSQRQRPPTDHSSGEFFDGGSSFPSGHAITTWSLATVIAQEYGQHRPLVRLGAYGLATVVSLSRYTGRNHFLSDVLVGSAMGYGIGRYVYRQHHDPSLDSSSQKQTSGLMRSRLFPHIAPLYYPQARVYGAMLAWDF
jgi:membrane-associated phospholipid phosphatase